MDTLTLFSKNLNQRSLTPRWPLTPCLLRSHVWLYPRIIVSKSHGNTSMYVDTVINFANCNIHTHICYVHTTYRMSDHIVSYWTQFRRDNYWTQFRRDKNEVGVLKSAYDCSNLVLLLLETQRTQEIIHFSGGFMLGWFFHLRTLSVYSVYSVHVHVLSLQISWIISHKFLQNGRISISVYMYCSFTFVILSTELCLVSSEVLFSK